MKNKPRIIIKDNTTHLAHEAARMFSTLARESVSYMGRFSVAISGGSTPREMHRMLAEDPYLSEIPWDKTHIFWVDERCVPENNRASNYGAAKKDFLDKVPVPEANIHPMLCHASPEDGAVKYQRELIDFFRPGAGRLPIFDLIILGVGTDGHTASLFPGQRALEEKTNWVAAVKGGNPDVNRLTLTYPVLNRARQIVFLISGEDKAAILKTIFDGSGAGLPAQMIQAVNGDLTWLIDREAARLINPLTLQL
jgi:6-phosphogluconolactonase